MKQVYAPTAQNRKPTALISSTAPRPRKFGRTFVEAVEKDS